MVESLYSKLHNTGEIAKQRVVERFDGNDVDERWTERLLVGCPTFQMEDTADQGFSIETNAGGNPVGAIDFNNIRQYSASGSVYIAVSRREGVASYWTGGVAGTCYAVTCHRVAYQTISSLSFMRLSTSDGTESSTNSVVADDDQFHISKIEIPDSTSVNLYVDGPLDITKTTDHPSDKLQPFFRHGAQGACLINSRIRYMEVYNI